MILSLYQPMHAMITFVFCFRPMVATARPASGTRSPPSRPIRTWRTRTPSSRLCGRGTRTTTESGGEVICLEEISYYRAHQPKSSSRIFCTFSPSLFVEITLKMKFRDSARHRCVSFNLFVVVFISFGEYSCGSEVAWKM